MPAGEIPRTPAERGDLPERFSSAGELISLASQMVGADQKRSVWRSSLEMLRAGAPVYPLARLQQMGQAWRARTNYRGLEGIVTTENTLDYDLETQGDEIVSICIEFGEGEQRADWERTMNCEFKWMFQKRWSGYNYHVPKRHDLKNLYGMGWHLWPDINGNWIPRTPNAGDILFPEDCPFNFDEEGDYFMLRDWMPDYILYQKIKNEKEAHELGWDIDVCWKALTLLSKNSGAKGNCGTSSAQWLADKFAQGDIGYTTTRQSGVWVNSVFVREFETGKVSQYSVAQGLDLNQYLYKKRDKYDRWPIELFPYDIGNGTIHSVKGLGDRTKDFFEMENRVRNAMVDGVMISSYPSMKQLIQNMDPDKMKLAKIGGLNWLPYGAEPQPMQYPDLGRGPLALMQNLYETMRTNNRGLGMQEVKQQDRMTAEEYAMRVQDSYRVSTASEAMQKAHLDSFYDRIVRECAKSNASNKPFAVYAREWRDRCIAKGVPAEAFKTIYEVSAVLAFGKGSASARARAYRDLFDSPVYLNASEQGKIAMERGYTGAILNQSAVEQYCRSANDEDVVDQDESFAVQENNALVNGGDALAASSQNQLEHLQTHFTKVGEIIQAYQQEQIDPQQAYGAIVAFGRHTKQHLDFLRDNPTKKQEFQMYFNQWQQLARIADKMKSDIESAAEATPPEQQVSENLQIGMAKVEANERVATRKAEGSLALKMRQQAMREQMEQTKLTAQQQRDNVKLLHGVQLGNVETAATISQDAALTQADIEHKKKKAVAA